MSKASLGGFSGMVLGFMGFAARPPLARLSERNPQIRNWEQCTSILRKARLRLLSTDRLIGYFASGPRFADIPRRGEAI